MSLNNEQKRVAEFKKRAAKKAAQRGGTHPRYLRPEPTSPPTPPGDGSAALQKFGELRPLLSVQAVKERGRPLEVTQGPYGVPVYQVITEGDHLGKRGTRRELEVWADLDIAEGYYEAAPSVVDLVAQLDSKDEKQRARARAMLKQILK
jgi:hypothetical protein